MNPPHLAPRWTEWTSICKDWLTQKRFSSKRSQSACRFKASQENGVEKNKGKQHVDMLSSVFYEQTCFVYLSGHFLFGSIPLGLFFSVLQGLP